MFILNEKKQCSKCKEWKSLDQFEKRVDRKNKPHSWCRKCLNKIRKERRERDPEKYREKNKLAAREFRKKFPEKALEIKLRWQQNHPEKHKEGIKRRSRNESARVRQAAQREKHKESIKAYVKRWLQSHPVNIKVNNLNRRARQKYGGGRVTKKEWQEVLDRYGHKCLCCGRSDVKLTMDHVVPLVLGGVHSKENIQPLCKSCNSKKHTKIIDYRKDR